MDVDEAVLAAEEPRCRVTARKTVRSYVRGMVGRVLSCLRCRSCGGTDRFRDSSGMAFEDIAGVDEDGGRKLASSGGSPRIFSYSELYIGTNGFSDKEVLGSGGFGRVYRAVLPSDGTTAAVKCIASHGDRFEKSFLAELAAVARLRHRNLVRLRGWCVHGGQELLLVYDYMSNRSLDRLLFAPPSAKVPVLSWERRRRIVAGLAAALFYLHEQLDTQIIHRDVKTSNVMLDTEYNARLGDFGLARWLEHAVCADDAAQPHLEVSPSPASLRLSSSASANYQFRLMDTSRIGGTIGYLPPESFQRRAIGTAKSDVFSFGIVLLEVTTGRRAVDLAYPDDEIFMLDWVRRLSDEGKLLNAADGKLPDGASALFDIGRLIHLGLLCSLHDPKARPTMKWVVENLSDGCSGDLPHLPSFVALPKYISLTSSSDSGITNITTDSTVATLSKPVYATAAADTIYHTAEDGRSSSRSADSVGHSRWSSRSVAIPNVDMPREISYKEIVAITNDFSESQVVAELDFGTGYGGFWDSGHGRVHVLVKRLGMKTCPALRVRFARELCNLAKLRHRNLVQLRGWCTDHGEMLVVYDYSPGSLLSHYLIRRDDAVLPWRQRYNIVKALASAILYLHEEWDEQVIHRNITSSAVFLDPDLNPRLGSFALAEFLSRNEHQGGHHVVVSSNSARGIFGYMSPEYMETGEATTMADIYSFGVVVLELVTGTMAVDGRLPEVLLVRKVQLLEQLNRPVENLVDRRLDGKFDRREFVRLATLGIACTRSDPAARPTMKKIMSILDGNDEVLDKFEQRRESTEDWQTRNAANLALVRRFQALGIH
ncbi:Receptor like protein kinase S.2 [Dichanthelium oligosanthes]|uniref:Receptor like protein kinase S.2 n=1 Tax=Dichanthelium oligosanthes TaxID=888268 RepID=A0A1E5VKM6_9POAL|nr:Receptor like protein kinase S.2 [Dichanthelium oligosanthes]